MWFQKHQHAIDRLRCIKCGKKETRSNLSGNFDVWSFYALKELQATTGVDPVGKQPGTDITYVEKSIKAILKPVRQGATQPERATNWAVNRVAEISWLITAVQVR